MTDDGDCILFACKCGNDKLWFYVDHSAKCPECHVEYHDFDDLETVTTYS